jgi:hypothetical protein
MALYFTVSCDRVFASCVKYGTSLAPDLRTVYTASLETLIVKCDLEVRK